jgi:hypothetical protein
MNTSDRYITLIIFLIIFGTATNVLSQEKIYTTNFLKNERIEIDGVIDEKSWETVEWEDGFIQREPYEGKKPSQETAFKILYDDNNLYIAIRVFDTELDKIEKRLTRRDQFQGDWVAIGIDSYFDKRTSFGFAVTAAGVKGDVIITNDDEIDDTWDPVWYVKTSTDTLGWMAEMKIPYTQLRFAKQKEYVWGLQVMRQLFRKGEFSAWKHVPVESSRWTSMFGELHGIKGIKPHKEVEIIPYVMGSTESFEKEEGNPFATGRDNGFNAGIDGKIAVTNDMTLNFTVNPDFGQVEADPSEVNLTAFETFFPEKRPFFIEGNNIFDYSLTEGDGDLASDNLFYSRRIGRRPHYSADLGGGEYSKEPEFTTILGAFKLSGKTRNGWSVGVMESLTQEEFATVDNEGERRKEAIEPMTNYFNTRIQKDLNEGNTIIGGMVTSTNCRLDDDNFNDLHHSAYTGGFDFTNFWKDKSYYLSVKSVFSQMKGNTASITNLQESSRRYFQRPDATHLSVDTTKTSLFGNGGTIGGGKIGGGHWKYGGFATWRTPGLELNDMGYMRQADMIQQVLWGGYRIWDPFSIFRSMNINFNQWSGWDFAGERLFLGGNVNIHMQFKNYWSFGTGINRSGTGLGRSTLWGGPAVKLPGAWNNWAFVETDNRKKFVFQVSAFNRFGDYGYSRNSNVGLEFSYRPINSLGLSFEPSYGLGRTEIQYLDNYEVGTETRYISGTIKTEMISADFRVNFSIIPDLSIQYWGQPFVFAGEYSEFKRMTNTQADDYNDRFHIFTDNEISFNTENEEYNVDENGDGNVDYSFADPDFKVLEFRSNLVLRWEYIPGSTLYIVWSQGREEYEETGTFNWNNDMLDIYRNTPHNIFLIKLSYRFSM